MSCTTHNSRISGTLSALLLAALATQQAFGGTGSQVTDAEASQAVAEHNRIRQEAGVSVQVSWDKGLASYAQKWANHLAAIDKMEHRPSPPHGENIAWQSAAPFTAADAVRLWEKEKSLYQGEVIDGTNYQTFGHYTQIIWHSTTKIGCGVAKSASGGVYVVCNYSPAGNIVGQKPIATKADSDASREHWSGCGFFGAVVEFRKMDATTWKEYHNGKHRFSFLEKQCGADFVELLDESRGIWVRLRNDRMEFRNPIHHKDYVFFYHGGWKAPTQ